VVSLQIDLPFAASRVSAWALDPTGARTTALTIVSLGEGSRLQLGNSGTTLRYDTNHRLNLDFNAKSRIRRVGQQVIQLLCFAFLPAW
jgi:hypothetical protein